MKPVPISVGEQLKAYSRFRRSFIRVQHKKLYLLGSLNPTSNLSFQFCEQNYNKNIPTEDWGDDICSNSKLFDS